MSNSTASLNLSVDDLPNVLESLTAERTRRSTEARLKSDLPFFAEYALRIRTKKIGTPEPLVLNQAQLKLHSILEEQRAKTGRVRAIILKGRQMGVSTYVAARFYHRTINSPGIRTFIVAHSDDGSRNLYQIVRRFQDSMPEELKPSVGVSNATELIFDRIDSGYLVSVASTEGVGRSATAQNAHLSEMAFWKNLDDHFAGLLQTIPDVVGSEIIIESTAFGFNDFHRLWRRAEAEEIEFIPIFLPWFLDPGYRVEALPADFALDDDEAAYAQAYGLDDSQMAWRRKQIALLGIKRWNQEYPATPNEAFVASDFDSFIPHDLVTAARRRKVEPSGPLIIGFDPAYTGKDRHAMVWRQGRAVTKIESRRGLDTMQAAGWCKSVIDRDKPLVMNIDVGGVGAGVVDRLKEQGYGDQVEAINFGSKPVEPPPLDENGRPLGGPLNRRAEMYLCLKEWLEDPAGVAIPDLDSLAADLCVTGYKHDSNSRLLLESKIDIRARGLPSPDEADAMALTFAGGSDRYFQERQKVKSAFNRPLEMPHWAIV